MKARRTCETCEHCIYVGDGGFWCDERDEMLADDWEWTHLKTCSNYENWDDDE